MESSSTDMIQSTVSGSVVVWLGHRNARNVSDTFIGILNGIFYFRLVSKTKDIFEQCDLHQQQKYSFFMSH